MFRFTLIDAFWCLTFAAACFAARTGTHVPALPLSALLVVTVIAAEFRTSDERKLVHYAPLLIGWVVAYGLSRHTHSLTVGSICGVILLFASSIGLLVTSSDRPHRKAAMAAGLVAWATLIVDPAPRIYQTSDVVNQIILCIIGLWTCTVLLSWRWVLAGASLSIFWTLQLGFVLFNARSINWGIGWYQRWIS